MAAIDETLVQRLLEAELFGTSGINYYHEGREQEADDVWTRFVAIDMVPMSRDRWSDTDFATVTFTVEACVAESGTQASTFAIAQHAAKVRAALDEIVITDSTTTHQIEMDRARVLSNLGVAEEPGIRSRAIMVTGLVSRSAGETLETHP